MKLPATLLAMASLAASAQADELFFFFFFFFFFWKPAAPRVAPPDVRAVAPALADYTDEVLFADVWARLPKIGMRWIYCSCMGRGGVCALGFSPA